MVLKNKKNNNLKKNNIKNKKTTKNNTTISKENLIEYPTISGYYYIIIFLILIILDRITKIWAITLSGNKKIDIGIVEFIYITNTGAGFSILENQNTLLSWIAVIAIGLLIYFYDKFPKAGFLMILSGIIGNLIDRILYGYVIDFINLKFWPVFNMADSLIFIGVFYTIIYWIINDRSNKKNKKSKKR
ncbi:MAG: hypothetical protein KatS3mg002_1133 [Candidatus Woesearchaeota archaeon]|nr:MAG: hypothetical protein KatS3mg002_1133 [Candidatus Woesearchaeota archaeon]